MKGVLIFLGHVARLEPLIVFSSRLA